MANLKALVDHVAKEYLNFVAPGTEWEARPADQKTHALIMATNVLSGAPILYDALRDDKLASLLIELDDEARDTGPAGAVAESVANRLRAILEG